MLKTAEKYHRYALGEEGIGVEEVGMLFIEGAKLAVPKFDNPIPIKENFKRMVERRDPIWAPSSMCDMTSTIATMLIGAPECDFTAPDNYDWIDWFGVPMTFVKIAGGPMNTPGTCVVDDVTEWDKQFKFPDLDALDWEGTSKKFMETYNPEKILHTDLLRSCTEQLVAVLGGYQEFLPALLEEPEAVESFFQAHVDFMISFIDRLLEYFPLDMVTMHDDWGTERNTFFSPQVMEDLVFEPTKRLFDYVHSRGLIAELHSCGCVTSFVPYMIDFGADLLQLQARANDMKKLKELYGDKIGFNIMVDCGDFSKPAIKAGVKEAVDTFGPNGGAYFGAFAPTPEATWDVLMELYCYSREFYESRQ